MRSSYFSILALLCALVVANAPSNAQTCSDPSGLTSSYNAADTVYPVPYYLLSWTADTNWTGCEWRFEIFSTGATKRARATNIPENFVIRSNKIEPGDTVIWRMRCTCVEPPDSAIIDPSHLTAFSDYDTIIAPTDPSRYGTLATGAWSFGPNPASDYVTFVPASEGEAAVSVVAMDGRLLRTVRTEGSPLALDVSELAEGTYMLVVRTDGIREAQPLVILR